MRKCVGRNLQILVQSGQVHMPKRRKGDGDWKRSRNKRKPTKSKSESGIKGAGYTPIVKENARFVKYYQGLGVVPAEEWDQFMSVIRKPLPSTFRITGTRHLATAVRQCLQHTFFTQLSEAVQRGGEGEGLAPPTPLPWYPNNLAWHIPLSKAFIRKSPEVSKFHRFLVDESDQGNISRQEAVSMIPPLLLDIHPHHKVLDMCAAPGSKTAQLIEMIHADDGGSPHLPSSLPAGVVVANDADNKRCYMLIHQAKRLKSPCFMVTNHDASVFPMLYYHDENDVRHPLHYDRVLCDVPCSGDGTLRKNPTIWRSWSPALGMALHKLQLRILSRGLELLQCGGRLVYSTCSLNPLENEAVIAAILQLCKGSVELVDVSDQLPGLKTIPGMTSWKVMNKKFEWETAGSSTAPTTLFPPDSSLLPQLNLHRCLRVLPHHQDTGGFFIAVIHKSDWLPWQHRPRDSSKVSTSSGCGDSEAQRPNVLTKDDPDSMEVEGEEGGGGGGEMEGVTVQGTEGVSVGEEMRRTEADCRGGRWIGGGKEGGEEGGGGEGGNSDEQLLETDNAPGTKIDRCGEWKDPDSLSREEAEAVTRTEGSNTAGMEGETVIGGDERGVTGSEVESSGGGEEGGSVGLGDLHTKPDFGRLGHRQTQSKGRIYKEDPYVFMTEDSDVWKLIKPYYGLGGSFPSSQLLTRSVTGKKRNIYLTSALVKELLRRNEFHVKFINVGVKVLARCDNYNTSCPFRLCQEGIESLVPFITKSRLSLTLDDLVLILKEPNPLSVQLAQDTQDMLASFGVGPALFEYTPDSKQLTSTTYDHPIYLSGWMARKSVRLYVDKKYRCHYLAMLGHEPPTNMSLASVSGRKDNERTEMETWKRLEEEGGNCGKECEGGEREEGGKGSGGLERREDMQGDGTSSV